MCNPTYNKFQSVKSRKRPGPTSIALLNRKPQNSKTLLPKVTEVIPVGTRIMYWNGRYMLIFSNRILLREDCVLQMQVRSATVMKFLFQHCIDEKNYVATSDFRPAAGVLTYCVSPPELKFRRVFYILTAPQILLRLLQPLNSNTKSREFVFTPLQTPPELSCFLSILCWGFLFTIIFHPFTYSILCRGFGDHNRLLSGSESGVRKSLGLSGIGLLFLTNTQSTSSLTKAASRRGTKKHQVGEFFYS